VISRRPRRLSLAAACSSVCLLVLLTGCGGSDSNDDSSSSATTSDGSSAAASLTKANLGQEIRDAQADAGSAHVEATVEAAGQTLDLAGDVAHLDTPESPTFDFAADAGGDQDFRLLVVDGTLYVSGSGISSRGGKKWVKSDISDPDNPIAQIFQTANPGNFSSYLQGVTDFQDKGAETVDGVDTEHYSVTVDTNEMLAANPVFKGQSVSQLGLPEKLTSELYVDDENRPVEIAVDLAAAGAFEVHFSDYGKDVSVQAPPADDVGSFDFSN
jgi:hypothetical protein